MERDRGTEGETSYLDELIGEEEQMSKKERDRGTESQNQAIDALIGEEENGKWKRT